MRLDERGKNCPLPVIETKKALESCPPGETVEVAVDNEIAVQNLKKLAAHKNFEAASQRVGDREFVVRIKKGVEEGAETPGPAAAAEAGAGGIKAGEETGEKPDCQLGGPRSGPRSGSGTVVVLSSNEMGQGDSALGTLLMKGFVYGLAQQDQLPDTVLLYNSGAFLACRGSENLEDLKLLETLGTEILTCGTCLNHYGLSEKLGVGSVTNMYDIVERMTGAGLLVRP